MLNDAVRRIVIATPAMGGRDGISEATRQYVRALEALAGPRGATVEIWSLGDATCPSSVRDGVEFRTARGSRFLFASFALRPHADDAATLVVVQHVHLVPVLLPLIWRGARLVPVLYGIEAWKPLRRLERAGLRRAWRIAGLSRQTVARFRLANPDLATLDVQICYAGVPSAVPRSAQRTPGRFALIVARMAAEERYKGHDALLDIWPDVRAKVPDAALVVAGDGDDRARLEQKARELGLADVVRFAGAVSAPQLAALYEDAAFFAMPSTDEGLGLVYLEAMRAGKPCVAAPGAAEEIIDTGVHGLIVDPADRVALTDALTRLFADDRLRTAMGMAAARRIHEQFTPERFDARVSALLGMTPMRLAC